MSSTKKIPNNRSSVQQPNTIDEKHTEILNEFHTIETEIVPRLTKEIVELKEQALLLSNNQIDEIMEIRDKIIYLKSQIKELCSKKKKYLLENSKYIFNYFEQKKNISSGGGKQNVNVLNNFFKINPVIPLTKSKRPLGVLILFRFPGKKVLFKSITSKKIYIKLIILLIYICL